MYKRRDSTLCEATGYELDDQDSISGRNRAFLFHTTSKLALGRSQPLIQSHAILPGGQSKQNAKPITILGLVSRLGLFGDILRIISYESS
jgi:hypothetical protein